MGSSRTDDLLLGFRQGDLEALRGVVGRYSREIHYFAIKLLKDRETAEEIVDDCFLKAWNVRQRFQSSADIKAFLYVVARNACLDHIKSPRSRILERIDEHTDNVASNENIEAQLIYTELISTIYNEVKKLPKKQRQVFLLSYFDGLSTQEIAERMTISRNAVFINKHEAIKAIRRVFQGKDILLYILFLHYVEGIH
ncbi:RNA polymerase sigma factor [Parapedobacter indicus]|uniref:RNA polymerase sigma-70 factor, ECF subfamily n=1 Tax=Parapedobacter indicus TaxID=1477437 RepID=A0A1I3KCL8_9SPHI|nr:RNA polymerase sigma-70 factor [Parapedobacter indicus]PPL01780.1 RNA polymerase sigma-70 factor (ECF subfamily) [Parapedobacter indicus]SFI70197.1 RNA polymerase sigma-70 factor, ECF subfamily [Parapedobacter indicus]